MHTKGPWALTEDSTHVTVRDAGGCAVYHETKRLDGAREISRMISAAPDLLEALEACLNFIENTESELGIILSCGDMARAAIAKAKGAG